MSFLKSILVIIFLSTVVWSQQLTFHNFKVFSVKVQTQEQLKALSDIDYTYWKEPILGKDADIVVPPYKLNEFNDFVSALNLNTTLKISDIQRLVLNLFCGLNHD